MLAKLKIWRTTQNDDGSTRRELVNYEIEVREDTTLLDVLEAIKNEQDGTLSFRKSCRMAVCGSCGMRMDGKSVLACKTRMKPIVDAGRVPVLAPMGNMPVIKDLVTDMGGFWQKVRAITPWLNRADHPEKPEDGREHLVYPEEQAKVTRESMCIMCGCCVSECNSMEANPAFLGPAALAKAYRFVGDVRDKKPRQRLEALDGKNGVWDCTRCYYCNERCPKEVDPRDAIAKLGAAMFDFGITGDKGARHAKVFINSTKGRGASPLPLYNGQLSETALVPFTLGVDFLNPSWAVFGAKMLVKGKAPAPWHTLFHGVEGLDEVRKLWSLTEAEETEVRRGGEFVTPTAPMPVNIAPGVKKMLSAEEIFKKTGAVITSDEGKPGGGHDPVDIVDPATDYGPDTVVAQFMESQGGSRRKAEGLNGGDPDPSAGEAVGAAASSDSATDSAKDV